MRERSTPLLVVLLTFALVACGDEATSRQFPVAPSTAQGPASQAALEARINGLINVLYASTDQGAAFSDFARIKAQVASRRTVDAQASIIEFVSDALAEFTSGGLQDPNGDQPPSTADALRDLVNSVAQFGGLPPPIPPSNPLGGDGAVAVVGPAGGTVVTSSGFGGVRFPPGALPANVIVVVDRLPNPTVPGAGPLPTTLTQYPLFYDYSTTPVVPEFAQPVLVGICQLEVGEPFGPPTQTVANRLQLAHPDPDNPTTVELLERVTAPFIDCAGVTLAQANLDARSGNVLERALAAVWGTGVRALSVFAPTPLYAVHGGLGGLTRSFSPFGAVDPGASLSAISVGANHSCALTNSGAAFCWGLNDLSQLGASSASTCGGQPCSMTPIAVSGGFTFQSLDAGGDFTCGAVPGGTVRCWGAGTSGQLGNAAQANSATPVAVALSPLQSVSVGNLHACALTPAGAAFCWGSNQNNALGATSSGTCGGAPCNTTPIAVNGALTFDTLSTGVLHSCGVTGAGAGVCWGGVPGFGALGNGTNGGAASTPTPISGGLTLSTIAAEGGGGCAITTSGQAYCWGNNTAGQLGNGTTAGQLVPVPVSGGLTFASLASTSGQNNILSHMCGVTTSGAAYCWGGNGTGQLGTPTGSACTFGGGPTPCSTVPVLVSGGHTWRSLAVGLDFTCGITTTDAVYCWGRNNFGQLGNGTTTTSTTPVLVAGSFGGP